MIAAELHIDGLAGLAAAWEAAPALAERQMTAAVTEASFFLWREVVERTPTSGAGSLRQSMHPLDVEVGPEAVSGGVGSSQPYAIPVELGTRPHMPPVAPIAEWVGRKLGIKGPQQQAVAWAIARKIAMRGTEGAFMFRRAAEENADAVLRIFEAHAAALAAELAGGPPA